MDVEMELPRLEFLRQKLESLEELNDGIITPAFQGKIFYINKETDTVYTQSRDNIGSKLYIRGQEIPLEKVKYFSEKLKKIPFEKSITPVFMIGRQDLLITHKTINGTQGFFLGGLDEKLDFIPGANLYKLYKDFFDDENIILSKFYKDDMNFIIPESLTKEEAKLFLDVSGAIVKTSNGRSSVYCTELSHRIFEMFSDTQNNLQLWVKCIFSENFKNLNYIPITMNNLEIYLPNDKIIQFREFYGSFLGLMRKFVSKKFSYALAGNKNVFYINYEVNEKNNKIYQKPEKSLATFIKHIKINLKKNFSQSNRPKLHLQIQEYIINFFRLDRNINNCCHLIKNYENIEIK